LSETKDAKDGGQKLEEWGAICCAECEKIVAHYPPEADIFDDDEIELYCQTCAIILQKGKH